MNRFKRFGEYRYERLAGVRLIRLLDLHPSRSFSDEIRGTIHHVRLDRETKFEALSYTWGNGKATCEIQCNEAPFYIRPSLEIALRFPRLKDEPRTLWFDTICINQNDINERE